MGGFQLRTPRLILREWEDADAEAFAAVNADPAVMEFFPSVLTRQVSDALIESFRGEFEERGFCPFALEQLATREFTGFVGLHVVPERMTFAPGTEVGWRLASAHWGRGYATEAAREVLRFGFEEHGLKEVVSYTSVLNVRSRAVMERLDMRRDLQEDFDHPGIVPGHTLRRHVLYRLRRPR